MEMAEQILSSRVPCPCCGYPTLNEAAAYDICELCDWEDDGQGEAEADEVRGGPNGAYSLSEARRNFRKYLVMYAPDRDTRIAPGDSERAHNAKRVLVDAFDRLKQVTETRGSNLLAEIERQEAVLREELDQKLREYKSQDPTAPAA
jgi:hypothetical protein